MEAERFNRIAEEGMQQLSAALSPYVGIVGGQTIAYNAYFGGTEVVVLGYQHNDGSGVVTKPLAILIDEVVFRGLRVDDEASRVIDGVEQPKHVQ